MKKALTALLLLSCLAGTVFASTSGITEFKAVTVECEDGAESSGKVWITNEKSRREFNNGTEIVITRNDLKRTWFIYPQIKCYVETPSYGTFADFTKPDDNANTGDLQRKFIGYEERDSFRMKKYLVTVRYRQFDTEDKYYEWMRSDFPVPVRTESIDGSNWTEYRNISRGQIDPAVFERPKIYKLVSAEDAEKFLADYEAKHPKKQTAKKKGQSRKQKRKKTKSADGTSAGEGD